MLAWREVAQRRLALGRMGEEGIGVQLRHGVAVGAGRLHREQSIDQMKIKGNGTGGIDPLDDPSNLTVGGLASPRVWVV